MAVVVAGCGLGAVHVRPARSKGRPRRIVLLVLALGLAVLAGFDAVEVIYDLAALDGEFIDELFGSVDPDVVHIGEAEVARLQAEDGNVSHRAYGEIAKLLTLDLVRGVRGHLGYRLLQGESDRHHLAGDVELILGRTVHAADVEIG